MATPNNLLINVQTYNDAMLATLQNQNCFVSTANTKFNDFQNIPGQLGMTVTYDRNPRVRPAAGLPAQFQPADQRILSLTVDKSYNVSLQFTDQQIVFNDVNTYMEKWGASAIHNIGAQVEADIARVCETTPYRFFGDGTTAINTFAQLASVVGMQKAFGSSGKFKGYISIEAQIAVSNSGQNQFVLNRNERIANSWEVGSFAGCDWHTSNLLPIHNAGVAGEAGYTLQVVSTGLDANGAVTSIVFQSLTASVNTADFVKQYDRFVFQDGVSSLPNLRALTFYGYKESSLPVQFLATADANSNGSSQVTVTITPPLQVLPTNENNINTAIVPGMQVKVMPSHRVGMVTTGNPLFVAIPALPDTSPFTSARVVDRDTGVGMRTYHGFLMPLAASGIVHDIIEGHSLDPDYATAILFPL